MTVLDIPAPHADAFLANLSEPVLGHPKDRSATLEELEADLAALRLHPAGRQAHFGAAVGESIAQALAIALGQVGYKSPAASNQHSKFNDWFAGIYGSVYRICAWCAIFMCWVGLNGSIAAARRTAGALALVARFPACARQPGALIGYSGANYPGGHVEIIVKLDANPSYAWCVGGNTSGGGQGAIGVYYTRRYLPGNAVSYSMPTYGGVAPVTGGGLAVDGVLGAQTLSAMQAKLGVPRTGKLDVATVKALQKKLKVAQDGVPGPITVRALQKYLGVTQDADWGPATTRALQTRLNAGTF